MFNKRNIMWMALFTCFMCNASENFSPAQITQLTQLIKQHAPQPKDPWSDFKHIASEYATKGAGYTACTLGFGFGLYELKNACASMVKFFTPTSSNTRNEKRRHGIFAASHTSAGLICCAASGYGLYRLLHQASSD